MYVPVCTYFDSQAGDAWTRQRELTPVALDGTQCLSFAGGVLLPWSAVMWLTRDDMAADRPSLSQSSTNTDQGNDGLPASSNAPLSYDDDQYPILSTPGD